MSKKILLNEKYNFFGLITIRIDTHIVNLGSKVQYTPENGFSIQAIIEEYNQTYRCLQGLEVIDTCTAYLVDESDNEIIKCTFFNIILSSEFHSSPESYQNLNLYPRLCIFNTYKKNIKINAIQIYLPFWNEFFFPNVNTKSIKYNENNEIFNIQDGWKLEFSESASYNLLNKEDISGFFIDIEEGSVQVSDEVKYLKPKVKHRKYILLKPSEINTLDSENISTIMYQLYKLRNFLSILFNMKINLERVVLDTQNDGQIDTLYHVNNNEKKVYDSFIYHMLPIKYSDIENLDEIFEKYYEQYNVFESIIEIMNQNIDESYSKYHFTRTTDCLKEIGLSISEEQPYNKAIEEMAIDEIKDEIIKVFKKDFDIGSWKKIGSKISELRGILTHFNNSKIDSNIDYYSVMFNLTGLFSIVIKAYVLKKIGLNLVLVQRYQKYHFDKRTTMKTMQK